MDNQTILIISIVAVVGLIAAWAVWSEVKKRRARQLRERFGSEYQTAKQRYGKEADTKLQARIKRVEQLNLRPLTPELGDRFETAWRGAMSRFIDDPALAVAEADRLVKDVLEARGYPIVDFERRVANISVDYPRAAQDYRAAHAVARKSKVGQASTEEMRESMMHFRSVFQDLLQVSAPELQETRS